MIRRGARGRRVAELEATNRALAAENARLKAHLELAQALAHDMLSRRIAQQFTDNDAASAMRRYVTSLHVYGASVMRPSPSTTLPGC